MRIARIRDARGAFLARLEAGSEGEIAVPILEDRGGLDPLRALLGQGDLVDLPAVPPVAEPVLLSEARLLAPVREPQKILGIGLNYADHAREAGLAPPATPIVFTKTANAIVGPDEPIRWERPASSQVDYEAELAVVIGRRVRNVSEADALDAVLGYTCCNDVSARDAQFAEGQWTRAKSFDTFCPLGPWIVTGDEVGDPQALGIACRVNGETLQRSTTAEMIFGVAALIASLSTVMTLEPGDVIATGTPFGVGFARTPPIFLADGDVVEIEIERIGILRNPVVVTGAA